ncbi:MAG: winged helix-turn-helix transcriptional regulator [Armatimonadetes bacterium]|nr:winged helix-turn-helix transcriptional regulator [Armatimonadota bacterium]
MKPEENGFTREDLKAKLFQGFADPIRIAILELLREREMCVSEMAEAVGCSQPRISNHLACLRWCQFVQTRKEGNQVIYSLHDDRIRKILELADDLLAANAEQVYRCIRI